MKLWIRSQDKEMLTKIDHLYIDYECFDGEIKNWYIYGSNNILGSYKAKERALEVLDEIQEYINNNCEFIERKTHTKMGTYTDKIETYVYEMPEE